MKKIQNIILFLNNWTHETRYPQSLTTKSDCGTTNNTTGFIVAVIVW